MRVLVVAEGNAETRNCWSGIGQSVVGAFRGAAHTVRVADVELTGLLRWGAAALTFAPNRTRWGARYRLGAPGFASKTWRAARAIERWHASTDVVLQFGATFAPRGHHTIPYALYCDSNIRMAEHGRGFGHSDAVFLTPAELAAVTRREASVYRGAGAIFAISERLRRSFIEDFGVPAERVHAVHAGPNLDPQWFASANGDRQRANILFVGRQFERKGGDTLLAAFDAVRATIPEATLDIVGPAPGDARAGVRWLGPLRPDDPAQVQQLVAAYRRSSVFCLPTRYEPFGIVFLEAMHFGLPCIGTDIGAVPEMVSDGVTGYTVPVGDVPALAARLLRVLRDPEGASAMGAAGRERARAHFTWPAVVGRMTRVLEQLRGKEGGAALV